MAVRVAVAADRNEDAAPLPWRDLGTRMVDLLLPKCARTGTA